MIQPDKLFMVRPEPCRAYKPEALHAQCRRPQELFEDDPVDDHWCQEAEEPHHDLLRGF